MAVAKAAKKPRAKKPKKTKAKTSEQKAKIGRPPALVEAPDLIRQIGALAQMQCTQFEAAAVLGVCEDTFRTFIRSHEESEKAWEQGFGKGQASLRRWQFESARKGSGQMQIWLGKQYLNQRDKTDVEGSMVLTDERSPTEITGTIKGKLASIAAAESAGRVPSEPDARGT